MIFKPFSELYLAGGWRRSPGYVKEESTKMSSHLHPLRLEWQMLTFGPVCLCVVSCVWLFATLMDCSPSHSSVHEIFREEHWSELPFPLLGDLPDPGTKPLSLASPALASRFFTSEPSGKLSSHGYLYIILQSRNSFSDYGFQRNLKFATGSPLS